MSILCSGAVSCLPRPAKCSTLDSCSSESVRPPRYFLDAARVSCGGEYDDEEVDVVRDIMMTVPVFLTLIIFSAFISQVRILFFILCFLLSSWSEAAEAECRTVPVMLILVHPRGIACTKTSRVWCGQSIRGVDLSRS